MPLPPIVPRLERRTVGAHGVRLQRWEARGAFGLMLLVPTRPGLTAGYDEYARGLCERGTDVAMLVDALEPAPDSLEIVAALVAMLRAERSAPVLVLAGHGVGGIVVGEAIASTGPKPDLYVLLAPSLGASPAAPAASRFLPWRRAPSPQGSGAVQRVIQTLSTTPTSVYVAAGWQDPLVDRSVFQRLQQVRPLGDVWNYPVGGHDIPNMGSPADRAAELAAWILRRASERAPDAPAWRRPPRPDSLDRRSAIREHEAFVATEDDRVRAFEALVHERGGPIVDRPRDGLAALGEWLLEAIGEGPRADPLPVWAVGGTGPERRLSSESLWLIDGAATFLLRTLRDVDPDVTWELCTDRRDAYYHQSLLQPLHIPTVVLVANILRDVLAAEPPADWLAARFDGLRTGLARRREAAVADDALPLDEVDVEAYEGDPWNARIWIPEGAEAVLGREAFESLGGLIRKLRGIDRLAWEDREVVLAVVQPETDLGSIRRDIVGLLEQLKAGRTDSAKEP